MCCFDLYTVIMDYCERCNVAQPSRCRCCRQILGKNMPIYASSCECSYPPQPSPAVASSKIQTLLDQCMRLLPDHSTAVEAEERVECTLCGRFFKNKKSLRSHKGSYHCEVLDGEHTDGSSCDLCHRIFANKTCLAIHMNKMHKKIDDGQ